MADWAPILVGVVLFILLSPGLLFQLPGHNRHVDFGGLKTNGKAIFIHTLLFFGAFTILIMAVRIHIYTVVYNNKVEMADWGPIIIGVMLFVLLSPGVMFQVPGHERHAEFGGFKTSGKAIVVHTIIFFVVYTIIILALHLQIYLG